MNTLKRIWNSMKGIQWDRVIYIVGFFVLMFAFFPVLAVILAFFFICILDS